MHDPNSSEASSSPLTAESLATRILTSSLDELARDFGWPPPESLSILQTLPPSMQRRLRVRLAAARSKERLSSLPSYNFPRSDEDQYWLNCSEAGSRAYAELNRLLPGD
ncbi:MAG: hypothetical protein AB1761_17015 [Pseudomonadota bacterium]